MNDKAGFRTAPATRGLVMTSKGSLKAPFHSKYSFSSKNDTSESKVRTFAQLALIFLV